MMLSIFLLREFVQPCAFFTQHQWSINVCFSHAALLLNIHLVATMSREKYFLQTSQKTFLLKRCISISLQVAPLGYHRLVFKVDCSVLEKINIQISLLTKSKTFSRRNFDLNIYSNEVQFYLSADTTKVSENA